MRKRANERMENSAIQKNTGFGCNNVVFVLMFVIMIQHYITPVNGSQCLESRQSLMYVKQCPKNVIEWDERAALKNCTSFKQDCVPTDQFMYHCVLNADGTKLLEVCAPFKNIHGEQCAEFDYDGSLIQENSKNCGNDAVPCPAAYKSTESFKYQACYDGVEVEAYDVEWEKDLSFFPNCIKSWFPCRMAMIQCIIYGGVGTTILYAGISLIQYLELRALRKKYRRAIGTHDQRSGIIMTDYRALRQKN